MSLRVIKNFDLARRLKIIYKGDFRAFLRPGGEIIRDSVGDNILHQRTPAGGRIQKNKKSTLEIKRKYGKGRLSLIWDRILIAKKTWWMKSTKKKVWVGLTAERKKIGIRVTKMGYIFMGISVKTRKQILAKWRAFIKRGLK